MVYVHPVGQDNTLEFGHSGQHNWCVPESPPEDDAAAAAAALEAADAAALADPARMRMHRTYVG